MTALLALYCSSVNGYTLLAAAAESQYAARSAIEQMGADIRGSSSAEVLADGEILVLAGQNATLRYYAENNCLYRRFTTSVGSTTIPMADSISSLHFSIYDSLVVINLGVNTGGYGQEVTTAVNTRL